MSTPFSTGPRASRARQSSRVLVSMAGAVGVTIAVTSTVVIEHEAFAAGYALDVNAARGTGMGAAVTGFIDDSSAVFYNAAGISQGRGFDVQVGDTLIVPSFKYTSPSTGNSTTTSFKIIPPFNAYASAGLTDELSLGIGVYTPFGLTLKWPDGWEGRRQITQATLQTFNINPTVAYRFGPVRVGTGLQIVRSTVELQRDIAFGETTGSTDLGAATWGAGFNVGAQVDAIPKRLSVGVQYRSAVKLGFDGQAHFDNVPRPLQDTIHDQNVSTSVVTPDSIAAGVAVRPISALVVDVDVVWLNWSRFRSIDLTFPDDRSGTLASTQAKDWSNTVNLHLGAEGRLNDTWRLRGGALYDPSPAPRDTLTPDIPDANRLNLALGGSYVHPTGFHADLGYQFIILFSKASTAPALPGDYGGFVNLLGLSVGYTSPPPTRSAPQPATTVGSASAPSSTR